MRARRKARVSMRFSGALQPRRPEITGRNDLCGVLEPTVPGTRGGRVLLQRAKLIGKGLAELPKPGVVGHDDEARLRVRNAGGFREHRQHDGGAGMRGRRRVAQHFGRPAVAPLRRQQALGLLVQRAERIGFPVGTPQREPRRLQLPHHSDRLEAPGVPRQIHHRRIERRRPHIPVSVAEPAALGRRAGVSGTGRHLLGSLRQRRLGVTTITARSNPQPRSDRPIPACNEIMRRVLTEPSTLLQVDRSGPCRGRCSEAAEPAACFCFRAPSYKHCLATCCQPVAEGSVLAQLTRTLSS